MLKCETEAGEIRKAASAPLGREDGKASCRRENILPASSYRFFCHGVLWTDEYALLQAERIVEYQRKAYVASVKINENYLILQLRR